MTKLTVGSLTPEQFDLIYTVRQEYIDALTKDFDNDDIIEKVKWVYKLYGLKEPRVTILDLPNEVDDTLFKNYIPSDNINDNIINKILFDSWKQLKESVNESLIDFVKKELENKLHSMYEENVRFENIIANIMSGRWNWNLEMERKYNVPILAIYDYFFRIGAINNNKCDENNNENNIEKFLEYIRTGIRYRIYRAGRAYVIRNNNGPRFKDELGRLNNEKGYAVVWRTVNLLKQINNRNDRQENIGYHFVKGVYFQPELFDKIFIKENISSQEILNLKNTEQKAIAIHHIGYDKFIKELNAKKLDEWKTYSLVNGNIAVCELYEFILDRSMLRFVKVQDHSTGKTTVLGVPINADTATAKGAVAWTFEMKDEEYNPIIET